MREDVTLYDRNNILFKMPGAPPGIEARSALWEESRNEREKKIIAEHPDRSIFYAIFGPYAVALPPSRELIPEGVVYRVVRKETETRSKTLAWVWQYYSTESFYGKFEKDFMNREVCAYFFFDRGKALILSGERFAGMKSLRLAREIGYNDNVIHSDMGVFLADQGFLEEARISLERALLYHEDLSGVHNNWGYYYNKIGEHEKAVASFQKAAELRPDRFLLFNNLGFALFETGRKQESKEAIEKSLSLHPDQPGIRKFMEENLMKNGKDQGRMPGSGVP
jgi:tetratricopeptide (TPR) repeat protein